MRSESNAAEASVALAAGPGGSGAATAEGGLLTGLEPIGVRVRTPAAVRRALRGPGAAHLSLAAILAGTLLLAVYATGAPSPLVSRSGYGMPGWMIGPLHYLFGQPRLGFNELDNAFSVFMLLMVAAYLVVVAAVRSLSLRVIVISIVVLHVVLALVPPMQLNDLFNYLGYGRLGAVHGLNPYVHPIAAESHDPNFPYSTWHYYLDPYGPLFTAFTYPLALLPLPLAYWGLKLAAVLSSLAFLWLLAHVARLLGRDPRYALAFVAFNPIFLVYEVGDFHNDFFMLVPALAAIALLLRSRDRSAGAALMAGVFVKFTVVLLLPFMLVAVRGNRRRAQILLGAAGCGLLLAAGSYLLFGAHVPNLHDQSRLVTPFSITNLLGDLLGFGGATGTVIHLADAGLVAVVLACLRRRGQWLEGFGWATIALIASLSWLMPWYIVWALPLAALGSSRWLRRVALAFTVFLVLTFIPYTSPFLKAHGIDPLSSPFGQHAQALQAKLEG
jgi:hypothetical protein